MIRAPSRRRRLLATATALALVAQGCGGEQGPDPPAPPQRGMAPDPARDRAGHERMLALLAEIAARTDDEHHYLGGRRARELRAQLEQLGARAPWQLHRDAGVAAIQYGEERAGLELLERAHERLADGALAGGPPALREVAFELGVGWLRLGETENCCQLPGAESCILPFRGSALHQRPEGSRNAAKWLLEVLAATPETAYAHLAARWLLNLAQMTLGDWPDGVPAAYRLPAAAFAPEAGFPRLPNIAAKLGLDAHSHAGSVVADDFDGDEHLDLLVSTWDTRGQLRLFHNQRDGTFADRTTAAGLDGLYGGLNLVQADYDNDLDLDFLVLRGAWLFEHGQHPNSLVRNNGDGTFTDVTFQAGLGERHLPTQTAAFADYDLDGDLDLYVGNESSAKLRCAGQLFRNQGDGTFVDVAGSAGVENFGFAKGVSWGDYDNDRRPDLYVANNGQPNRLYRNLGDGTFADVAVAAGVTGPIVSFPCWFWDFDNDGALDLYVASYATDIGHLAAWHLGLDVGDYERAKLYRGDGRGGFRDVAQQLDLGYPAVPMGSNFGDLDNDGWLDFYLGTGNVHLYSLMPNVLFWNRGGSSFTNVTMASGLGHLQKGHGVAFADLDHDGDLDVFEQMGGAFRGDAFRDALYENPGFGNHWLAIRLVGTRSNRSAIGARIRVVVRDATGERSIFRHVNSGGSFGCNPLRQTIGLGRAEAITAVEVFWPVTGSTQQLGAVPFDCAIRVVEGEDGFVQLDLPPMHFGGR